MFEGERGGGTERMTITNKKITNNPKTLFARTEIKNH